MLLPGDTDESDEAPAAPGMLRTTPDAAAKAEKAAVAESAAAAAAAQEGPVVTEGRMKELKDQARAEIDRRLKERRKKRRLMRGGDAPSTRAFS